MTFDELNGIIYEITGKKAGMEDRISALKFSSLEMMNICGAIEDKVDADIDIKRIKGITAISELLEYVTSLEDRMIFDVDMKDGESFRYLYDEKYALDFIYYRLLKGYDGDRLERSREVLEELKQLSRGEILYYDEFKVKRV